jgi:quinate dehydrogenase
LLKTQKVSGLIRRSSNKLVANQQQVLGVRNALIGGLRLQFPTLNIPCEASYRPSRRKRASPAGLVIGVGARARSAIYALSLLGLHPIFILNRDDEEIECLMGFFPNLKKKKGLIYLKNPTDVAQYLSKPLSPVVLMVVGAIRAWGFFIYKNTTIKNVLKLLFIYIASVAPVTIEEHMLYTTLSAVLKIPYKPLSQPGQRPPLPLQCLFLEMTVRISIQEPNCYYL